MFHVEISLTFVSCLPSPRQGEMADPYFSSSRLQPAPPLSEGLAKDSKATPAGQGVGDYKDTKFWRENIGGELYEPPEAHPRSYEKQILGLYDLAGMGLRSYQPGVTDPN